MYGVDSDTKRHVKLTLFFLFWTEKHWNRLWKLYFLFLLQESFIIQPFTTNTWVSLLWFPLKPLILQGHEKTFGARTA